MAELDHFALLTTTKRHFHNAFIVHITTNNPCHLSLYYTRQTPLRHKVTRIIRGTGYSWGAYFCFVGWNIRPQWEAGDTLEHTFLLSNLEYSEKVWYTFRGTVGGNLSPSSGPIIEHVQPMQDIILGSTFEDWPAFPNPPDGWFYSSTPGDPPFFYQHTDRPLPLGYSCAATIAIWFSYMRLRQRPAITYLSDLPLTFQVHYKGLGHWHDFMRVVATGDTTHLEMARPTLPDIWQSLTVHITMPTNLTLLLLELQNTGQAIPPPKTVLWWYPDIFYGYVY